MYIKKVDLCFTRISDLRLNFVHLKVNRLKFTDNLNKLILCLFVNFLKLIKELDKLITHDHLRTIRLKHLILIK